MLPPQFRDVVTAGLALKGASSSAVFVTALIKLWYSFLLLLSIRNYSHIRIEKFSFKVLSSFSWLKPN